MVEKKKQLQQKELNYKLDTDSRELQKQISTRGGTGRLRNQNEEDRVQKSLQQLQECSKNSSYYPHLAYFLTFLNAYLSNTMFSRGLLTCQEQNQYKYFLHIKNKPPSGGQSFTKWGTKVNSVCQPIQTMTFLQLKSSMDFYTVTI